MSEQNQNELKNVNDILNVMNRVNESFAYEVWIPSLKKNVMFREVNTSQQKRLIKSIIDSPIYNTEFIFAITQIIKENCAEPINADELTILDKLFICLKMRENSINDTYELSYNIGGKTHKRGVSLNKVYEDAKTTIDVEKLVPKSLSDSVYTINCKIPTIKTEYRLEKELRNNVVDIDVKRTPDNLRQVIGDMFMNELIKFIDSIVIKIDEEQEMKVDFSDAVTYVDRISIIEKMPVKLVDKVIQYIKSIKEEIEKVNIIEFKADDNGKEVNIKEVLTIDGNFFINS